VRRRDDEQVDVLVERSPRQAGVLERAAPHTVADAGVPADDEGSTLAREVEHRLPALPPECRTPWARIRASGTEARG
jgi:hypothetical protein